jgi:hypothetical protein
LMLSVRTKKNTNHYIWFVFLELRNSIKRKIV